MAIIEHNRANVATAASRGGGAVFMQGSSTYTLTAGHVRENTVAHPTNATALTADQGGGGFFLNTGNPTLTVGGGTITRNILGRTGALQTLVLGVVEYAWQQATFD